MSTNKIRSLLTTNALQTILSGLFSWILIGYAMSMKVYPEQPRC